MEFSQILSDIEANLKIETDDKISRQQFIWLCLLTGEGVLPDPVCQGLQPGEVRSPV